MDRMRASTSHNSAGAQHDTHRHNTILCRRKEHLTLRKRQAVLCQAAKQQQQREKVLDSERPDPGLGLKAVWYGAEQFGNVLGLTKKRQGEGSEAERPRQISRSEALASIRRDYDVNYFVSGVGDMEAYEPNCLFADPFAGFNGVERFKRNVSNLGGLMEDIQLDLTGWEEAEGELRTRWRFNAILQLPWRPRLAAAGGTTHVFSPESGRVVKHIESWDVKPERVVRSLIRPSSRVPTNQWETAFNALDAGDYAGVWLAVSPAVAVGAAIDVGFDLLFRLATNSGPPGAYANVWQTVFLGGLEGLAYVALAAALATEAFKLVRGVTGESG